MGNPFTVEFSDDSVIVTVKAESNRRSTFRWLVKSDPSERSTFITLTTSTTLVAVHVYR